MRLALIAMTIALSGCVIYPIPNCPNGGFPEQVPGSPWFICRPPKKIKDVDAMEAEEKSDLQIWNERTRSTRDREAQEKWAWKMDWCKSNGLTPHHVQSWQHAEDAFILHHPGSQYIDP